VKIIYLMLLGLLVSAGFSFAACPQPDISTYNTCTTGCPDPVKYTESYAKCINSCLSSWGKVQDAYYACQKAERDQAEQKRLEAQKAAEQKKLAEEQKNNTTHVLKAIGYVGLTGKDGTFKGRITADTVLKDGDTVKTGANSLTQIQMPDGHTVSLGPNTEFTYHENQKLNDNLLLENSLFDYDLTLLEGRMRILKYNLNKKFGVRTSGGAGAIRGTDVIVEYNPSTNITKFYLHEGIVDVSDLKGNNYTMSPGQTVIIDSKGLKSVTTLRPENWDFLVRSIETGEEFTPGNETVITNWRAEPATAKTPGKTIIQAGAEKTVMTGIVLLIIVIAIGIGTIIRAKVRRNRRKEQ
jgi:hypothetical protein